MADEVEEKARPWPRIRAALLLIHVIGIALLALPSTRKMRDKDRWDGQRTQGEFALWADRLQKWGVDTDASRLSASLWKAAQTYAQIHETLTAPLKPYVALAGVRPTVGHVSFAATSPGRVTRRHRRGQWFSTLFT